MMRDMKSIIYLNNIIKILLLNITLIFLIINPSVAQDNSMCGPYSIKTIYEYYKVDCTIDEICRITKYTKLYGSTLYDLYEAALLKNLPAIPLNIDIIKLCTFKNPSIAFVDGNHFLVVHGCKGNKVIIQDPPGPIYTVSKEAFKERWHGEALVFDEKLKKKMSKQIAKATAPPEGPHIHIYETTHDAGTVYEGTKLSHTFSFVNIGKDTLSVTARSTCSCSAALLSDKNIPPGGKGKIKIEFNTKGKIGQTKQGALIRTNDPDNPLVNLTIVAIVKASVKVVPEKLWIDEIAAGEKVEREILVFDPGDSTLSFEHVNVTEGITARIMPVKVKNDSRVVPVLLSITGGKKPGEFEKRISVKTNDPVKPELTVTIAGIVVGEAKAFPPLVFFGEAQPDSQVIQTSTITSTNGNKLKITRVASNSPFISTEIKPLTPGEKYTLITTLRSPEPNTTVRDSLRVYAEGKSEPVLKIPVYARVTGKNK